jgi:hypothetical protein
LNSEHVCFRIVGSRVHTSVGEGWVLNSDHACLGVGCGRVYTRDGCVLVTPRVVSKFVHASLELLGAVFILGSVKFSPRVLSKLVHPCFGIARCRVHTKVGEVFTEAGYKVGTCLFRNGQG